MWIIYKLHLSKSRQDKCDWTSWQLMAKKVNLIRFLNSCSAKYVFFFGCCCCCYKQPVFFFFILEQIYVWGKLKTQLTSWFTEKVKNSVKLLFLLHSTLKVYTSGVYHCVESYPSGWWACSWAGCPDGRSSSPQRFGSLWPARPLLPSRPRRFSPDRATTNTNGSVCGI